MKPEFDKEKFKEELHRKRLNDKLMEIAIRYVGNTKEGRDMVDEMMGTEGFEHNLMVIENLKDVIKSKRELISDINQWSHILLSNRHNIRERVLWAMIADINNRTTD